MLTVMSYDVSSNTRRTKVLTYLKGYGTHVQYSVFECDLTAQQFARVQHDLQALIDRATASVRCYRLDATAVQQIAIIGVGRVTIEPLYYLVGAAPSDDTS